MQQLHIRQESWPIAGSFTISRGSKTSAEVVVVTLERDGLRGQGECVPYGRYGETVASVVAAIEGGRAEIEHGLTHADIPALLRPMAARNALDCALWDLEAKLAAKPVWQLVEMPPPQPLLTAFTLSLDSPQNMAAAAQQAAGRPLLKLKLGGERDAERLQAVRKSAPKARLIVDANEGWQTSALAAMLDLCAEAGVELVEQPLPAADDEGLRHMRRPVPVCADESAHDLASLDRMEGKYDAINIKLDKAGGLTAALALRRAAEERGLAVMVGCMLATSLSMAPASILAQGCAFVDLDGPLLLTRDRTPPIRYEGSIMHPPPPELWG